MLLLFLVTLLSVSVKSDSYLDAYKESHSVSVTTPKVDREYSEPYPHPSGPGYYEPPKQQYGPPTNNFSPIYAPPSNPAPVYGPPANPAPVYGPPMHPAPIYGPPLQPVYGNPHGYLSFFEKLKYKLDLFTVGKILLKIVLFKKFVSFVAVLCLLLFIPTLKRKVDEAVPEGGDDDDDDDAKGFDKNKENFLNNLTQFVLGSIDNFSKNYTEDANCKSFYCQAQQVMKGIDDKLNYSKLAKLYSKELQK